MLELSELVKAEKFNRKNDIEKLEREHELEVKKVSEELDRCNGELSKMSQQNKEFLNQLKGYQVMEEQFDE